MRGLETSINSNNTGREIFYLTKTEKAVFFRSEATLPVFSAFPVLKPNIILCVSLAKGR